MRANISLYEASDILARLKAGFRIFDEYCASVADHAGLRMVMSTAFGWSVGARPARIRARSETGRFSQPARRSCMWP